MTLTTHAVVGAAVAQIASANPIAAFLAAFASHFVIDAIPHGHYALYSKTDDPAHRLNEDMKVESWAFFYDIVRIGIDIVVGISFAMIIFHSIAAVWWMPLLGAIAGILPDALQFAYWKIRREPLTSLQRFHIFIHAKARLDSQIPKAVLVELALVTMLVLATFNFVPGFPVRTGVQAAQTKTPSSTH